MAWPWEIVERDHVIQNPTSAEKILLLGDGIPRDRSLLDSIPAAIAWLHAEGLRDRWPVETLRQIDLEADWVRDRLHSLR